MTIKLSKLIGRGRGISFPLGKPPKGTCEFTTLNCLEECGDRCTNFEFEKATYELFRTKSVSTIVETLLTEINDNGNNILTWFPESGDCPKALTNKLIEVMHGLSMHTIMFNEHIFQNGFTRNYDLWVKSHKIDNMFLVLTEENINLVEEYKQFGLVGVPNYQERRVKIYNNNIIWVCGGGGVICGCGTIEDDGLESDEDCSVCMESNRGCFAA